MSLRQLKSWIVPFALLIGVVVGWSSARADTWQIIKFPLREAITGMSFISPDSGYVCSAGAKYGRTFDGGKSWKFYVVRKGQDSSFEDICFINKDTGIICGRYGMLYRTVNACAMWESIWLPDNDKTPWLTSALLLHGGGGVMVGMKPGQPPTGVAYRTSDAGGTWTKLDVKGLAFGEIFYRPGEPICFQSWGRLNYSTDQGVTWNSMAISTKNPARATAFKGNSGIICGNSGSLAYSKDRGKTWTSIVQTSDINFTSAVLVTDSIGYVCGTKGVIIKTSDGGATWTEEKTVEKVDYAGLYVVGNSVYAYGADGVILKTTIK